MTAFEENKKTHMQVQRGMKKRGQRKRIAAVRWERRWVGREPPPPQSVAPPREGAMPIGHRRVGRAKVSRVSVWGQREVGARCVACKWCVELISCVRMVGRPKKKKGGGLNCQKYLDKTKGEKRKGQGKSMSGCVC